MEGSRKKYNVKLSVHYGSSYAGSESFPCPVSSYHVLSSLESLSMLVITLFSAVVECHTYYFLCNLKWHKWAERGTEEIIITLWLSSIFFLSKCIQLYAYRKNRNANASSHVVFFRMFSVSVPHTVTRLYYLPLECDCSETFMRWKYRSNKTEEITAVSTKRNGFH